MNRLPEFVSVERPSRISATQVETASSCPLRFLLDGTLAESDMCLPSSSAMRYAGELLHGVVEDARKGLAGNPPEVSMLADRWRERVVEVEAAAASNGDEAWLPLAETVSTLERTRLSAFDLAKAQFVVPPGSSGSGTGRTEVWLRGRDGLVVGKVDAIDRSGNTTVLSDYKSGAVLDDKGSVKSAYITQMHIYAALFHEESGEWPDELELVDRSGDAVPVPYTHAEASDSLDRAEKVLRAVQSHVGGGGRLDGHVLSQLGNPEGGVCSTCRHRPVCPRHVDRVKQQGLVLLSDTRFPSVDAFGIVCDVEPTNNGRVRLRLQHGEMLRTVQGLSVDGRFLKQGQSLMDRVSCGDAIGVFGAMPRRPVDVQTEVNHLMTSRSVVAYKMEPGFSSIS